MANWSLERSFRGAGFARGIGIYVAALVAVLAFGGLRLGSADGTENRVAVAAVKLAQAVAARQAVTERARTELERATADRWRSVR